MSGMTFTFFWNKSGYNDIISSKKTKLSITFCIICVEVCHCLHLRRFARCKGLGARNIAFHVKNCIIACSVFPCYY